MELKLETMSMAEWYALRHELHTAETGEDRFHEKKLSMAPDYVRQHIVVELTGASVELQDDSEGAAAPARPIVALSLHQAGASVLGREDGTLTMTAQLHSLSVLDWHSR